MKTKKLTTLAILAALTIVLQLLSGLLTGILPFSLSLVLIPISIAAWYYGISGGLILGGAFGITVFIQCVTGLDKTGLYLYTLDPLATLVLSFGRCLLVGLIIGIIGEIKKSNTAFKYIYASLAPIMNTTVFTALYALLFNDVLMGDASSYESVMSFIIIGLVGINFVIELALNVIILPPLLSALDKYNK